MSNYMVFAHREANSEGKYPIVDAIECDEVVDHSEYFKFKVDKQQYDLIKNLGCDCIRIDLLRSENPNDLFYNAVRYHEVKDVVEYGEDVLAYLEYNEPVVEE